MSIQENVDYKDYCGNLRLESISFDTLTDLFEGDLESYDPADKKDMLFYIGKVGKYVVDSYLKYDGYDTTSQTVQVQFSNGHVLLVTADDVSFTEDGETWSEFLPDVTETKKKYAPLTDDEKKFADLVILQLIASGDKYETESLLNRAITISMRRSLDYNMLWKRPIFED